MSTAAAVPPAGTRPADHPDRSGHAGPSRHRGHLAVGDPGHEVRVGLWVRPATPRDRPFCYFRFLFTTFSAIDIFSPSSGITTHAAR